MRLSHDKGVHFPLRFRHMLMDLFTQLAQCGFNVCWRREWSAGKSAVDATIVRLNTADGLLHLLRPSAGEQVQVLQLAVKDSRHFQTEDAFRRSEAAIFHAVYRGGHGGVAREPFKPLQKAGDLKQKSHGQGLRLRKTLPVLTVAVVARYANGANDCPDRPECLHPCCNSDYRFAASGAEVSGKACSDASTEEASANCDECCSDDVVLHARDHAASRFGWQEAAA